MMHRGAKCVRQRPYVYVPVSLELCHIVQQFCDNGLFKSFLMSVSLWMMRRSRQMFLLQEVTKRLGDLTDKLRPVVREHVRRYTIQ